MKTVVAIDQGTEALRGILLRRSNPKSPVELVSAGQMLLGDLGRMPDNEDRRLALTEKLKELVKGARLRGHVRRLAASGKAVALQTINVPPVPPWRLDMLVAYEVEGRGDKEPVAYDYRILDMPEVGGQYTVLVGTCKEREAEQLLAAAKQAKLGEVEIDLESIALYNAYYHGHGFDADKTVLVADIGAEEVHVILARRGSLYFAKSFLSGGSRFTQVLADEFKIEWEEAESLKKNEGEIRFDLPPAGGDTTIIAAGRGPSARTRTATGSTLAMLRKRLSERRAEHEGGPPEHANGDSNSAITPPQSPAAAEPPTTAADEALPPPLTLESPFPTADGLDAPLELISTSETGAGEHDAARRMRRMSGALVREAAALCAAIENSVTAFRNQNKLRDLKIERIYLTGGSSKLKGLSEFMSRRLRAETAPLEPLRNVSMSALPPQQAEELRAEQHALATCLGLALSELCAGTFSFLLWPRTLVVKKERQNRDAYLTYAAMLTLAALFLVYWTFVRNNDILADNIAVAKEADETRKKEFVKLEKVIADYEEINGRFRQIDSNIASGHFFMRVLAELRDTSRIQDYIYLTEVSTVKPKKILELEKEVGGAQTAEDLEALRAGGRRRTAGRKDERIKRSESGFQAEQVVYIRGFAVAPMDQQTSLVTRMEEFFQKKLVPEPHNPDSPKNLFQDVRVRWFEGIRAKAHVDPDRKDSVLMEFILECFVKDVTVNDKAQDFAAEIRATTPVSVPDSGSTPPPIAPVPPVAPPPTPTPQPTIPSPLVGPKVQPSATPKDTPRPPPTSPIGQTPKTPEKTGPMEFVLPDNMPQPTP
jgi:Tfp pilus assembly PilM family ATPase